MAQPRRRRRPGSSRPSFVAHSRRMLRELDAKPEKNVKLSRFRIDEFYLSNDQISQGLIKAMEDTPAVMQPLESLTATPGQHSPQGLAQNVIQGIRDGQRYIVAPVSSGKHWSQAYPPRAGRCS
ncbi:hypothetical protein F5X98DRAFT_131621 [Xylaria grammica]|nr:hypothetical protein F5X98DRAFT_131621 [Xylaria grammica]